MHRIVDTVIHTGLLKPCSHQLLLVAAKAGGGKESYCDGSLKLQTKDSILYNTYIATDRDPFSFSVNLTMYRSIPIVSPWVTKRDCSQRKRRMGLFEVFDILKYTHHCVLVSQQNVNARHRSCGITVGDNGVLKVSLGCWSVDCFLVLV